MSEYGDSAQEGMEFSVVCPLSEPNVAVIGCGGAGNNVIESIYWSHPEYDTIALNDNEERINSVSCSSAFYIKPEDIGSIEELYTDQLKSKLDGHDIIFIITGMGGTFGSIAAPFVAGVAASLNATVITVCIQPFAHENRNIEEDFVDRMRMYSSFTIVFDNNRLAELKGELTLQEGFDTINRAVGTFVDKIINSIKEAVSNFSQFDVAEEIRYDLLSVLDVPGLPEMSPGSGMVEGAQASLFTVHGPYFNF
ncbi:MAG: hypothetical protein QXP70_00660 [Methanomassiliicoccales archaeon]